MRFYIERVFRNNISSIETVKPMTERWRDIILRRAVSCRCPQAEGETGHATTRMCFTMTFL